ncbi:hypothetical protein ACM92K_000566 [Cronobacter turicensis]
MAKNDFKPFATSAGANVTSQANWEMLPALSQGFTSGKAASAQVNKAIRQSSFVASALAQFVADQTGADVLDNGNIPDFQALLKQGLAKQYLSRQNPFGDIKSDGTAAQAKALENLGLGNASYVVNRGSNANGSWIIWSDGAIEVMGAWVTLVNGLATVIYPIELKNVSRFISIAERFSTDGAITTKIHTSSILDDTVTRSGFKARCQNADGTPSASSFSWRVYCAPV